MTSKKQKAADRAEAIESLRKFLKMVGVSSQREIDQAVAKAIAAGSISGTEALAATMTLRIATVQLDVSFDGEIRLQ